MLLPYEKSGQEVYFYGQVNELGQWDVKLNEITVEGYYHDQTSNGMYNDTTGSAYSVKYADDGTIRTLYVGNMVDGQYEDETGNAWYITKSEDTDYMYYKGFFKAGKTENNKGSVFKNNLTLVDIGNYILGYEFDIELNWYKNEI